jgi:hypothetical protein
MSCSSDLEQIRQALTAYYEALYYGQAGKLEEAFRPDAVLLGDVDGVESGWTSRNTAACCKAGPHHMHRVPYGLQIGEIRSAAMPPWQSCKHHWLGGYLPITSRCSSARAVGVLLSSCTHIRSETCRPCRNGGRLLAVVAIPGVSNAFKRTCVCGAVP